MTVLDVHMKTTSLDVVTNNTTMTTAERQSLQTDSRDASTQLCLKQCFAQVFVLRTLGAYNHLWEHLQDIVNSTNRERKCFLMN